MPACCYRLLGRTVGSFIDRFALHSRLHTTPGHLSVAPLRRIGLTLKRLVEASRCPFASGTPAFTIPGRAQQRNTLRSNQIISVGLRIHPDPNLQSNFSGLLSCGSVKSYRQIFSSSSPSALIARAHGCDSAADHRASQQGDSCRGRFGRVSRQTYRARSRTDHGVAGGLRSVCQRRSSLLGGCGAPYGGAGGLMRCRRFWIFSTSGRIEHSTEIVKASSRRVTARRISGG